MSEVLCNYATKTTITIITIM